MLPFPGQRSTYRGFDRWDFPCAGVTATCVVPAKAAPGRPWIWRAEFWDHEPGVDVGLLERGFHLAYLAVGNTFGCPQAMERWDVFYDLLTQTYGLARRPALEGLSRGGLYCYRWAARHPTQVACLYGDNPVCDFRSWPAGRGHGPGSPADWRKLLTDYGFANEAEALAWPGNPVDQLRPLAEAKVPLLHVCGDADEVVPYEENSAVVKARYRALGGDYREIIKPGGKHHPHGLTDPAPIIAFVLEHGLPDRRMRQA